MINDDSEFANIIVEIYSKSDCRYGYRKIYAELIDIGFKINKKKVQRIMKELGLSGLYPKKKCITTIGKNIKSIHIYWKEWRL
ncbi:MULTISPECIES: IS3 family transposase [unclassified Candidatus Tisiphia]|uniref:IS3 family transposase n=1 Tax=unclassified Candidatus Tisiphia TaxID=2996318 RepID=UPI0035C8A96C